MITATQIKAMVEHWLSTPPNGYFSQSYGADIRSMLLQDLSQSNADELLAKLRVDIPLLDGFSSEELSVSTQTRDMDTIHVFLMIGNLPISLGQALENTTNQDYYDSRAK